MQLLLYIALLVRAGRYFPSKWDPLVSRAPAYDDVRTIDGWFARHNKKVNIETFGDVSVVTLNLYTKEMEDPSEEQVAAITNILDHMHPTILCLQGVDRDLMWMLRYIVNESRHYMVLNDARASVDLRNGQEYFLPVVYDGRLVTRVASGYFKTRGMDKILYASWARFKFYDIEKKYGIEFTAINIDLFSSFKDITNAQFSNIVADITTDWVTSAFPVVIAGGIMVLPESIRALMASEYKNLVDADPNNDVTIKTTFHAKGWNDDNVQRDFIILRDRYARLRLNYARVLSRFPMIGNHFPVHAILSVRPKPATAPPKKPQKKVGGGLEKMFKDDEKKHIAAAIAKAEEAMNRSWWI